MFSWATGSLERLSQTIAPVANDPISRFVYACQQGDEEGAMQLVPELGGAGVIVNPSKGYVPVHVACLNTLPNLTRLLLTQPGASVEIGDADGNTGLHCAAMSSKPNALELVTMLISDVAANVTAKNSKGQTPYDVSKISSVRQYLLPLQLQKETREALDNGGQGLPPGIDLGGLKIKNSTLAPPPMMMMGGGGGMSGGGGYPGPPPSSGGGGGMGSSYPQLPPQMGGYVTTAAADSSSSSIPRAASSDGMEHQQTPPPPPLPSPGGGHRVSSAPASCNSSSTGYSLSGSSSAAIYKPPPSARGRSFVQPDGFHSSSSDKRLQEKYGHLSSGNLSAGAAIPPPPSSGPGSGNLPSGIAAAATGNISAPPSFGVANNPYAGGASHLTARRSNRYVSYDPITGKQQPPPPPSSAPPPRAASFSYLQQPTPNFNVFTPPSGAAAAAAGQQQQQQQSGGVMPTPAPASGGYPTSPSQYQPQPQYQQYPQQQYQQQEQAYQQQQQYEQQQQQPAPPGGASPMMMNQYQYQPPASPAAAAVASSAAQYLMQPPPQVGVGGGGSFGGGGVASPLSANSASAMFGTPSPVAAATAANTASPTRTPFQQEHQQPQQSPSHMFARPGEASSPLAAASALFGAPPTAVTAPQQQEQQQYEPALSANAYESPQREYQHAAFGMPPQPADQPAPTAVEVSPPMVNAFAASQPIQPQNPAVAVAPAPRSNDGMMGFSSTLSGSIAKAPSSGGGMPLDFGGRAASIRSAADAFSAPPGATAAFPTNNEATPAAAAAAAAEIQIAANSNVGGAPSPAMPMPVGNPIQGVSLASSGGAVDLFSKPSGVSAAAAFSSQAQAEPPKVEEVGTTAATTTADAALPVTEEMLAQKPPIQQAPLRSWSVDSAESASELFSKGPPGATAVSAVFSAITTTATPPQEVNPELDTIKDELVQEAAAAAALVVDAAVTEPPANSTAQEDEDPDQMDDIPLSPEAPKGKSTPAAGALSANELFSVIGMPPPPFQKK